MIQSIFKILSDKKELVDSWISHKAGDLPPLVYSSVDVRNAGFKISVVDTNLFPAGFNNLCDTFSETAAQTFRDYFQKYYPEVKNVCIIPEEHTRNTYYWENVYCLMESLNKAGLKAWVGQYGHNIEEDPFEIIVLDNKKVWIHPLTVQDHRLQSKETCPDAILINNDLSSGIPKHLTNLHQVLLPSPNLGWHSRKKSRHFYFYNQLVQELATTLDIDPWLLSPITTVVENIDWKEEDSVNRMKATIDDQLKKIAVKYDEYGIPERPYVFVKNNSGTYGMAVMPIFSSDEVLKLNRRQRNKMNSAKGGGDVEEYLVQEGIPTRDFYQDHPLEPIVYLVGGHPVGSFFRINKEKNVYDNLNTKGMLFSCLCFHKLEETEGANGTVQLSCENSGDLFRIPSLLGQIATLAAQQELKELEEQPNNVVTLAV
jgi:glutamate--cysteine ligase